MHSRCGYESGLLTLARLLARSLACSAVIDVIFALCSERNCLLAVDIPVMLARNRIAFAQICPLPRRFAAYTPRLARISESHPSERNIGKICLSAQDSQCRFPFFRVVSLTSINSLHVPSRVTREKGIIAIFCNL